MPRGVPRPVIIDTDPGIDDALALMLALRSPEVRVLLLTTVAGNVPVEVGTANASRLLALINPAVWPVLAQGASRPYRRLPHTATAVHGDDGLGGATTLRHADKSLLYPLPPALPIRRQAVQRLLQLVQQYGQDLTIVALGPLTNLARAIQRAPQIMRQLGHLIIMGGAIGVPGNISPVAEFNIFVDPHAADLVLTSGLPMTLVPLDVTRQVRLTQDLLCRQSQGTETVLVRATRHMTQHMLGDARQAAGMPLHDPLAVAVALQPGLVQCEMLPVRVETRGQHTLGMTVAERRPEEPWAPETVPINVALKVDAARMLELFARRVLH